MSGIAEKLIDRALEVAGAARDIALMILPGLSGQEVAAPDSKTMRFEFSTSGAAKSFSSKLERYGCITVLDIWPGQKPAVIVYR